MADFDPQPWKPPRAPRREGAYAENAVLAAAELWETGGIGPEDVAVAGDGSVYTGLVDGTIVRFSPGGGIPNPIANTGGRPLGIEVDPDGSLIVCDAHKGLLRIDPAGNLSTVADAFNDERFIFTNNATIATDGTIYFTVTSRRHGIERYVDDLLEHNGTGRLFAVRPGGTPILLRSGLQFANGVALSEDESVLYVAETGSYAVNRFYLSGDRAGVYEPFLRNLPGFPDNITFGNDTIWIALVSPRQPILDSMMPKLWMRRATRLLPEVAKPKPARHGMILGFAPTGELTHNLQDSSGKVAVTSGVRWHDGRLYVGSLMDPTLAVLTL